MNNQQEEENKRIEEPEDGEKSETMRLIDQNLAEISLRLANIRKALE